jgi:hypothetical protein
MSLGDGVHVSPALWVVLAALLPGSAIAAHCPYETLWGQKLQLKGSWPEQWVYVDYGDGLRENCQFSLLDPPPHLAEVSGWMPPAIAICPEWTAGLTLPSPDANLDAHPSIAVFDGNVFYEACPSERQNITRLGALVGRVRE